MVANCGGDGTLLRIIYDFRKLGIQVDSCIYVTLPFGSANDLPRVLGWGKKPTRRLLNDMDYVMQTLQPENCVNTKIDVWNVHIETAGHDDEGRDSDLAGLNLQRTGEI